MATVNHRRACVALACLAFGAIGCGHEPIAAPSQPVIPTIGEAARVVINPGDTTIDVGADLPLRVFVFDVAGHPITSPAITATTDKPQVATITGPATVAANFIGNATITVRVGGASASVNITVVPHFVMLPLLQGSKTVTLAAMNDAGVAVGTMYADVDGSGPRAFRYTPSGGVENLSTGFIFSYAYAVNAGGTIAGWAQTSSGSPTIATWSPAGNVQVYSGKFGYSSSAWGMGINNSGQIAAYFEYLIPGYGVVHHSGRFDPATQVMTDVFSANPNGNGEATAITDAGTVIGFGTLPGSQSSSFAWSPQTGVHTIPLPDGRLVSVHAVSPNGTMAGYAGVVGGGTQSVLIAPTGQMTLLPTFGDSLTVLPIGVSDQGDIVGNSLTFLGWPEHVMYWRQGVGLIDLSTPIGRATHARGITPSGTVVFGGVDDVLSTSSYGGYTQRPCLWILRRQ